eukprot:CAMPEP_0197517080 /NCGR_PEP_ID=MMETSP1318-20131121/2045_1 /TAXON_ID=552666 /ORGANISM="Partenskyella glossopodia, Strain RCC365" /LENGTH=44 /DNA_ID= /DNA_START= /DNA_END= /DNA_ORIENTATION=
MSKRDLKISSIDLDVHGRGNMTIETPTEYGLNNPEALAKGSLRE